MADGAGAAGGAALVGAAVGAGGGTTRATGDVLHVVTQCAAVARAAVAGRAAVPRDWAVSVAAKPMASAAAASRDSPRFFNTVTGPASA